MTRAAVSLLPLVGFVLLAGGVLLHQSAPVVGAIAMVTGTGMMSLYLIGSVTHDYLRHRRAKSWFFSRPQLDSATFAATFFPTDTPLAARLRDLLAGYLNLSLEGLLPDDDLNQTCNIETEDPSLVWHLEKHFDLGKTFETAEDFRSIEQSLRTFRGIMHFVSARLNASRYSVPATSTNTPIQRSGEAGPI